MKKIKKIIFIIPLLFVITGCSLKYDVVINKNLKTEESLKLTIENSTIEEMILKYGDNYINEKIENAKKYFEEENYNFESKRNGNITIYANKSNNIFSLNKEIMDQSYNYYDFSCNEKYCLLYATADNNIISGDGQVYSLDLSIQVPYKVIESNADKVDVINNTYTWYSTPNNNNSDIKLLFYKDGSDIVKRNRILYFIIIGIFAIIGLGIILLITRFILRIIKGGKPA